MNILSAIVCAISAILCVLVIVELMPDRRMKLLLYKLPLISYATSQAIKVWQRFSGDAATSIDLWRDSSGMCILVILWVMALHKRL